MFQYGAAPKDVVKLMRRKNIKLPQKDTLKLASQFSGRPHSPLQSQI